MKKRMLPAILVLAFAVSCSKGGGVKGDYVAKVGDKNITKEEIQTEMSALPPMGKASFMGADGVARFVDQVVKREGLYLEAKKRGLENDKDAQKKIEEAKKIALINYMIDKEVGAASQVGEKDIRDYYESHKDDFINNKEVRISKIVVGTPEDAMKALKRIRAGEDFAKVAADMSTDRSSSRSGGDIGFVNPQKTGALEPNLVTLALSLKKGQVSDPAKTENGIYILKVTDIRGDLIPFEQVKSFIPRKMAAERQKAAFEKLMETVNKDFKVEINKEALAKIAPVEAAGTMKNNGSVQP